MRRLRVSTRTMAPAPPPSPSPSRPSTPARIPRCYVSAHIFRHPGSPSNAEVLEQALARLLKGVKVASDLIIGAIYPGASWSTPEGRRAGLNRWCAVIAREVGKAYQTKTERGLAEAFVRPHRLSIANAFERKLVRKDCGELTRLFEARMSDP
jgi:hypothetical protein